MSNMSKEVVWADDREATSRFLYYFCLYEFFFVFLFGGKHRFSTSFFYTLDRALFRRLVVLRLHIRNKEYGIFNDLPSQTIGSPGLLVFSSMPTVRN